MAWVTPIGSAPEQIEYRLGQQHGCAVGGIDDAQLEYRTEQERPLVWVGEALADLGIQAGSELTPDQFDLARTLVAGYHPRTGEQLVQHKLGIPREAKVSLAPLVRMIEGVAREARVDVAAVLRHREGRWAGRTSKSMLEAFHRAQRAVDREGEVAALRADHAGRLADAAGLSVEEVWGEDTYAKAAANLTKTVTVVGEDGTVTEKTVDNRVVVGNLAYDFSIGLHKSVVLLREFADEATGAALDKVFTDEAMRNFAWLEKQTAYGMRGHHGDGQTAEITKGNGFAGWAMIHRSARPADGQTVGDPHWHVHFTIANMTRGEDGKWSTVAAGGRDLMRHAAAADRLMQASARKVLTERYGITWRRSERTRNWEVEAIPDAAIREFSQRGADIKAMLLDLGFTEDNASAALKRMVKQETRNAKTDATTLPDSTLREYYQARARAAGFDPDALARAAMPGPDSLVTRAAAADHNRAPALAELADLLQDVEHGLTSHTRRFSRIDALCAVADALPTGGTYEQIETLTDEVLRHAGFVPLSKGAGEQAALGERPQLGADHMTNAALYTTRDVLDAEKVIVATATASHDDQTGIRVPLATAELAAATIEAANGFQLSAEQRRELFDIVTSGRQLDALVGGPGAGKTTLMDAVRAAYQAEGFVIAGAATQGTAAQNLQAESGIPSRTVAQWLWRIKHGPGLRGVDVLVIDEAGMTKDRDRVKLYLAATEAGAKIVEVGDPKQLRGVGEGSMFAVVHRLVDGGELLDNRRQADADERAAIAAWRRGDYSEALTSWADRDRLVVGETGQEATASMLATWMDQRQGAPDAITEMRGLLMVASTNEQVDRLNAGAQAVRQAQGELGEGRTYDLVGGRSLHLREHDHVMVRINDKQPGQPDALNGYRGVVEHLHDDGRVTVRWDRNTTDGRVAETATFTPEYVAKGGLTLGYAITIHKSQGMTIGSDGATWTGRDGERRGGAVLFYAAGADNAGSFVAASRHKLKMWMFLARKDVESSQDEYLLGVPRTTFERTRRVITKLIDRAKQTEINANDRPVMVDLGLLDDPTASGSDTGLYPRRAPADVQQERVDGERRRALRAKRDAVDAQRRETAADLLREQWGEHPAVRKVTDGVAFGAVARWLDKVAAGGGDPRAVLRSIDPDALLDPRVADPSKVAAAAVKQAALAGPGSTPARPQRPPRTKNQRRERRDELERQQRDQVADLLREEWGGHPAVDQVVAGPAFGALAQSLSAATAAGHDPRAVLRAVDPAELAGKDDPSAFTAWRIRTIADRPAQEQPAPPTARRPRGEPLPPADAPAGLDVLVPAYEQALRAVRSPAAPVDPLRAATPSAAADTVSTLRPGPVQPPADDATRVQTAIDAVHAIWPQDADWIVAGQSASLQRLANRLDEVRQAGYDPQEFMREALVRSSTVRLTQPNEAVASNSAPTSSRPPTSYEPGIPHPGEPGTDPIGFAARWVGRHFDAVSTQHSAAPVDATRRETSERAAAVAGVPAASDTSRPAPAAAPPQQQPGGDRRQDAMWPSWLPPAPDPQPLSGRERAVATAAAADARRIRARVVDLGRTAARERPDWVRQLGPAPRTAADRVRYLAAITTIAAYREQHGITGPDPLGAAPAGAPTAAYAAAIEARDRLARAADKPTAQRAADQGTTPERDRRTARPRPDDLGERARRILEQQQQRRARQNPEQDPHRPGPGQGPRPGF